MNTREKSVVAVILAAGAGTRLRPLTDFRPKPLCPINNVPLLDWALRFVAPVVDAVAVTVHHSRDPIKKHLESYKVHVADEDPAPYGAAGALASLRPWIDGRDVLVVSADAWCQTPATEFISGWDHERVRLWVVEDEERPDFRSWYYVGISLMPWREVAKLTVGYGDLVQDCWRPLGEDALEFVPRDEQYIDCGVLPGYLAANLLASGGATVVGENAVIEGEARRSVIWPNAHVAKNEVLVDCIRIGADITICPGPYCPKGRPQADTDYASAIPLPSG